MVNARIHAPDRIERCEVTVKYRKKPVVIEAVQYTEYGKLVKGMCNSISCFTAGNNEPHVHTIHNGQTVNLEIGDYIIPEPDGEHFYPCKPDIFEATYSIVSDYCNFGLAIEAAKSGAKISRQGWNGKGMFVVYQKGYPQGIPCNKQTANAWGMKEGDLFRCEPYLQIQMVNGSHSMWVPSVNDVLAEDWTISE